MADEPPSPPPELPDPLVHVLDESPPERLRQVSRYAEALAEYRDQGVARGDEPPVGDDGRKAAIEGDAEADTADGESGGGDDDVEFDREDRPEGVPSKATLTVKEINGNRYEYWQWREGETVTSKYKGPVTPDE